jgi:hypothetical protein
MLTFLTLLLGIVWGPRDVELSAPVGTVAVEIFLDGESLGQRSQTPWTFRVDLGPAPAPHLLDAVARDARGVEIGRARLKVNVPRPQAEAVLALLPGKGGKGRAARLSWEGAVGGPPSKVTLTFDGKPLAASDPERIDLPTYVPERLHFLRAVVEFGFETRAEAEITFGGRDHDESSRELTAVPLRVPRGTLSGAEAMAGWFVSEGETLHAVAVEEGEASIVFVIDANAPAAFRDMWLGRLFDTRVGTFRGDPEVRVLSAYSKQVAGSRQTYDLYRRSFPLPVVRGMMEVLAKAETPSDGFSCPRLADATSAAGIFAATWSHPRAVVLVLTGNPDASVLSASGVRSYLADLGVPLIVWIAGSAAPEVAMEWGGGRPVKTRAQLRAAVHALELEVEQQRIVWVEGAHLPQAIFVTAAAPAGVAVAR